MYIKANKQSLIVLIIIAVILVLSSAQNSRPKTKNRNKSRSTRNWIKCMSCYVHFGKQMFDPTHLCYNPSLNNTESEFLYLTQCSPYSKYCIVDITRTNGELTIIDRRCGPPDQPECRELCFSKGYGIDTTVCTYCCKSKVTEDDDNYNGKEHANYTCPTGPH